MKIEWKGGECPVSHETRVKVWFNDGKIAEGCPARSYYWMKTGNFTDIIAYEVIENKSKPIMASEKTLRDEFAKVWLANFAVDMSMDDIATECYAVADAMMKAREK